MNYFPTTRRPARLEGLSVSTERPRRCDTVFFLVVVGCLAAGGAVGFVVSSWFKLHGL